jgi:peptidoglycan/LPS O-acetylase OafA/YrhL
VAASRKYSWYGSDYIIGATFALVVPGLAMKNMATSMYRKAAELLSDTSYTLYVTHFPFLAFVFYVFFLPTKHYPDWRGSVLFVVILAGALLYAKVVWWCFERNTHLYRRRLHSGLSRWGVRG